MTADAAPFTVDADELPTLVDLADLADEAWVLLGTLLDDLHNRRQATHTEGARELFDWLNDRAALAWAEAATMRHTLRLLASVTHE